MRVLLTGASGFIGRHVVAELLGAGHLVATVHRGPALAGVEHTRADVLSKEAQAAARAAEAIVHLAGQGNVQDSFRRPADYNLLNAVGTLNILEGARDAGTHVVLASTQRVYAPSSTPLREDAPLRPTDPYGTSKHVAEHWCEMYAAQLGTPTTIVRLFSVYGMGQVGQGSSGVVSIFLGRARRGEPLQVHARQRRDLTEVGDVARGIRMVVEQPPAGSRAPAARVYNLATGVGTDVDELARLVVRIARSTSVVVPPIRDAPEGDRVADISRARIELGYRPEISVEAGLRRLVEQRNG